jgi:hypothetical protein
MLLTFLFFFGVVITIIIFGERIIRKKSISGVNKSLSYSGKLFRTQNFKATRKYHALNGIIFFDGRSGKIALMDTNNPLQVDECQSVKGFEINVNGGIIYKRSCIKKEDENFNESINDISFLTVADLKRNLSQIENLTFGINLVNEKVFNIVFFDIWYYNFRDSSNLTKIGRRYRDKIENSANIIEELQIIFDDIIKNNLVTNQH